MARAPARTRRDAGRPRGEAIVDTVLTETLQELAAHGVESLSVERIARAADVNKTSVYRRWPTREALVAAALERVLDDLTLKLPDTGSWRGDLIGLVTEVGAFLSTPTGRALARAAIASHASPELAELARRRIAEGASGPAGELVARAVARGDLRPDVDPRLLLSTLVGAVLHRLLLETDEVTPAFVEGLVDLVLLGVTPRGARSR